MVLVSCWGCWRRVVRLGRDRGSDRLGRSLLLTRALNRADSRAGSCCSDLLFTGDPHRTLVGGGRVAPSPQSAQRREIVRPFLILSTQPEVSWGSAQTPQVGRASLQSFLWWSNCWHRLHCRILGLLWRLLFFLLVFLGWGSSSVFFCALSSVVFFCSLSSLDGPVRADNKVETTSPCSG